MFEAADAAAEAVADGPVDDGPTLELEQVHEVDEELGDGFVFAGLAGEDEEELAAVAVQYAVEDGADGLELVVVEGQLEDVAAEGGDVEEDRSEVGI